MLAACGDGPAAAGPACGNGPFLISGEPVQGVLGSGDRLYQGSYIDYYSLQLDATARVDLTLVSARVDPFLYLFDSENRGIAQAFHPVDRRAGEEEVATLTRTLEPGCYLVGASSWTRDQAGGYTLRAEVTGG